VVSKGGTCQWPTEHSHSHASRSNGVAAFVMVLLMLLVHATQRPRYMMSQPPRQKPKGQALSSHTENDRTALLLVSAITARPPSEVTANPFGSANKANRGGPSWNPARPQTPAKVLQSSHRRHYITGNPKSHLSHTHGALRDLSLQAPGLAYAAPLPPTSSVSHALSPPIFAMSNSIYDAEWRHDWISFDCTPCTTVASATQLFRRKPLCSSMQE